MNKAVYKSGVSNKFFSNGILALPYILSRPPNKWAIAFLFSSAKSDFVLPQSRAFLFVGGTLLSSFLNLVGFSKIINGIASAPNTFIKIVNTTVAVPNGSAKKAITFERIAFTIAAAPNGISAEPNTIVKIVNGFATIVNGFASIVNGFFKKAFTISIKSSYQKAIKININKYKLIN
jgi:hypothetical protein